MKEKIKDYFKNFNISSFLMMNVGLLLSSVATVMFISPSSLVAGGTTGLSVLLQRVTGLHYYYFLYGFNFILILISFVTLGKKFTLKTIYGSLMVPTYGALLTHIVEWCNIDVETYLAGVESVYIIIIASVIMGLGVGTALKNGGSTGGFDILEAILFKYVHIPYSVSMYILDAVLIISGGVFFDASTTVVFQNGIAEAFGAVFYIFMDGFMVDLVSFGSYNKRAVYIQSEEYEKIKDYIVNDMKRGVTFLESTGGFTNHSGKMVVCVCLSREYFILRDAVQKIDPNAFIFVAKATEVRGLGYSFETKEHIQSRKQKKI